MKGSVVPVDNWSDILFKIAELLVEKGDLTDGKCPLSVGNMTKRYLVHSIPSHATGKEFGWSRRLSNGLYLESKWDTANIIKRSWDLLTALGQDPAQFHVQLG